MESQIKQTDRDLCRKILYETYKSMYFNRELLVPDQNDVSLGRNAIEVERDIFRKFKRKNKEDYHGAISDKAQDACRGFFAIKGRPGTKRWCIEDGQLICKEKVEMDGELMWADVMSSEQMRAVESSGEALVIALDSLPSSTYLFPDPSNNSVDEKTDARCSKKPYDRSGEAIQMSIGDIGDQNNNPY